MCVCMCTCFNSMWCLRVWGLCSFKNYTHDTMYWDKLSQMNQRRLINGPDIGLKCEWIWREYIIELNLEVTRLKDCFNFCQARYLNTKQVLACTFFMHHTWPFVSTCHMMMMMHANCYCMEAVILLTFPSYNIDWPDIYTFIYVEYVFCIVGVRCLWEGHDMLSFRTKYTDATVQVSSRRKCVALKRAVK